jgi:hypothetical protein
MHIYASATGRRQKEVGGGNTRCISRGMLCRPRFRRRPCTRRQRGVLASAESQLSLSLAALYPSPVPSCFTFSPCSCSSFLSIHCHLCCAGTSHICRNMPSMSCVNKRDHFYATNDKFWFVQVVCRSVFLLSSRSVCSYVWSVCRRMSGLFVAE